MSTTLIAIGAGIAVLTGIGAGNCNLWLCYRTSDYYSA